MIPTQSFKYFSVVRPAAIVDNASWTSQVIDTKGFDHVTVLVHLGANDIAMAALKLQESDVASDATTLTNGADITTSVFGTAKNSTGSTSTLPSADDDNKLFAFHVDCRGRKRYIKLIATNGDGSAGGFLSSEAILSRGSASPASAALRGLAQELIV